MSRLSVCEKGLQLASFAIWFVYFCIIWGFMMDEVWCQMWVTGTVVYDCFPLTVSYAQKQANHAYAEYMLCISIFFFLMFGALFTAAHGHADELVYVLLPVILCVMACTSGDKRLKHCTKMTLFIVYGILGCIGLAFCSLTLIAMDNQEMNGMLAAMVLHLCCTIWTWMNSEDMDFADENYSIQSIQEPMIRDIKRGEVIASAPPPNFFIQNVPDAGEEDFISP